MHDPRVITALALLALGAGTAVVFAGRRRSASVDASVRTRDGPVAAPAAGLLEAIVVTAKKIFAWAPPAAAAAFRPWFEQARALAGLPELLLERVAFQESRFRPDIIDGRTVSAAGALGLMQIVPKWHPGVNPLDPPAAINYAGRYLRQLRNRFGSWQLALAAYNWGQGNVANALRDGRPFATWPVETQAYVRAIAADVPQVAAEDDLA